MIYTLPVLVLSIGEEPILDFVKKGADVSFEELGHVEPVCFIEVGAEPDGTTAPVGTVLMIRMTWGDDHESKCSFIEMVRRLAGKCKAKSVTMLAEVWEVHGFKSVSMEEVEAIVDQISGNLADHPDRVEAVNIVHETFSQRKIIHSEIRQASDRRYLYGWEELDATFIEGRMSNLLPVTPKVFS